MKYIKPNHLGHLNNNKNNNFNCNDNTRSFRSEHINVTPLQKFELYVHVLTIVGYLHFHGISQGMTYTCRVTKWCEFDLQIPILQIHTPTQWEQY